MDFYSVTLAAALGLAVLALGLGLSRILVGWPGPRAARWVALVAIVVDFASATEHWLRGHATGSPTALAPIAFLAEHVAFLVVFVLAVVAAVVATGGARRSSPTGGLR